MDRKLLVIILNVKNKTKQNNIHRKSPKIDWVLQVFLLWVSFGRGRRGSWGKGRGEGDLGLSEIEVRGECLI